MDKNLKEEIKTQKSTWKNRKKMAWVALISMILLTYLICFVPIPIERLKVISEFVTWFYFACTGVIGSFMGLKTWENFKKV